MSSKGMERKEMERIKCDKSKLPLVKAIKGRIQRIKEPIDLEAR